MVDDDAQRWHTSHGTTGTGALYQGRYKAVPVQTDEHFITAARYVERNPVRAGIVARAEDWRWSSAWRLANGCGVGLIDSWPVARPENWDDIVNAAEAPSEWDQLREAITRSAPFGSRAWRTQTARRLGIPHTIARRGRPGAIGHHLPDVEVLGEGE